VIILYRSGVSIVHHDQFPTRIYHTSRWRSGCKIG